MDHRDDTSERKVDPTRVLNQPAIRRSGGTIWIVVGAIFLVLALVPFGALIFFGSGKSAPAAAIAAVAMIVMYSALVLARLTVSRRMLRVRIMMIALLAMAAVGLGGVWVCAVIESASVVS